MSATAIPKCIKTYTRPAPSQSPESLVGGKRIKLRQRKLQGALPQGIASDSSHERYKSPSQSNTLRKYHLDDVQDHRVTGMYPC